jgi:pectate lyase
MNFTFVLRGCSIIFCFCLVLTVSAGAQDIIPTNIAFGTPTRGGLDGEVIRVTTLNSDGPGSFREAVNSSGPRIVVFEVGGVIDLNMEGIVITEPFLTIAGQTAPFPGITFIRGGFSVRTHDVMIQHIRIRPGDAGQPKKSGWEPDGLSTSGGEAFNIIIDHCSFTWAVDENLSASGPRTLGPDSTSQAITFSNNLIAECLDNSSHAKGRHSKGTLIHDFCRDIAIVGNLFAHNVTRNPYFKAFSEGVIVNNLIYNPGNGAIKLSYVQGEWKDSRYKPENCRVSIVGNVMYRGADSRENLALVGSRGDAYMEDNLAYSISDEPVRLTEGDISILEDKPSWPSNLRAIPTSEVTDYVVKHVGARPNERDEIDSRIIRDFLDRKGRIIDSQKEVGGYPKHEQTYRKLQIPDTNLERWLSELANELER